MAEKNQIEWIYEVLGKKKGRFGADLTKLTEDEEKSIKEKMVKYWKEHNNESTEFLVKEAVLCCNQGSDFARLQSGDHGVYIDSAETMALATEEDKSIIGDFGACAKLRDNKYGMDHVCMFSRGEWKNVRKTVTINGKCTLDTNSYLPCLQGGIITPVTSGQEYTLSTSYNKYPKFLNDDGTIDELIVKKLFLRNTQQMKENEVDALIKLGIYLCVCEDVNIIKKIICCGYITTLANKGISKPMLQHTLLDNLVYVSVCATAYARLCSLSNKLYISHRCSWSELDEVCKRLKSFIINLNTDVFEDVQKEEEKERKMRKQFLNIKLLETILLAGNIYNYKGQDELIEKLELKESKDSIISYTLEYYDGELEELVNGGFKVNVSLQTVYVFTKGVVDAFSGNDEFVKKLSGSIGSKVLDGAVAISYGTAVVSLLVSIPTIAAAPFATPLGVVCTVAGSTSGALDSNRADKEFKKSVTLYLDSINNNLAMLRMESYLSLYYTISLRVSDLLKANKSIWNRYEQFYPGAKKGQKSRKDWYITKDIHETAEDVPYEMLGKGQTYNISYFDSYLTMKKIRNFNENMKHIKVWNYGDKEYKTISESERMEEFSEISNIEEMITYMKKQNQAGSYYINELDIVGHDKTEKPTKIIYDYGNGEEKILVEKDVIGIVDLFKDNSLR